MITFRIQPLSALTRKSGVLRACVGPTMYRAINNNSIKRQRRRSAHRRGGNPGNQRTAAACRSDRGLSEPLGYPTGPNEIMNGTEMIRSSKRVFSVPRTARYATLDTQNECARTSRAHAQPPADHRPCTPHGVTA